MSQRELPFSFTVDRTANGALVLSLACPSLNVRERILIVPMPFGVVLCAKKNPDVTTENTGRAIGQFGLDGMMYTFISGQQNDHGETDSPAVHCMSEMMRSMVDLPNELAQRYLAMILEHEQVSPAELDRLAKQTAEFAESDEVTTFLNSLNLDGI